MIFCFMGITTLISTFNRDRWRTILISGGFFVVSLIVEIIAKMWTGGGWLSYLTFLSAFAPQRIILMPEEMAYTAVRYDATLVGVGLLSYAAAGVVFSLRDIPTSR